MIYLLDTNVWVSFLRRPASPVVPRLQARRPDEIRVCSVVRAELVYGALRSANPIKTRSTVNALLLPYICLPFDETSAGIQAQIRHHLESLGTPIGPYDLQIAAIALANGCTLVTHNTAEFSRVPGLLIEDWEVP
jgi:tRNA(fMet)-specific endonuclease VapC